AYAGRRRVIGERMHESLSSMAQLTLTSETRVDAALEMLHGLNREWRPQRVVVTLPVLVLRACALALREHPRLNARLEGAEIVVADAVHVGLAVDDEAGLVVPVVRHADRQSLQEIAHTVADLVERTKERRVTPDELSGGTFTVTALDGSVVDAFTPVINPPQAAILGLGRVREVPVIEDGAVRGGRVAVLSLTFDHRVLDGAPAARFLGRVAELLGRPYLLM
ncbi:MAG: 2-oxo acid dehydrogenase subunit E2, partial [Chloroflexi bacterium]|nr:2-oxo acid dehydrogenase subunit E2 [Chloroflexota bacterium]